MYKLVIMCCKTREIIKEKRILFAENMFHEIYKYYHEIRENKVMINIINDRSLETVKINNANLKNYDEFIDLLYQEYWNE